MNITTDTARAIAELAVSLKCDELAYSRRMDELDTAERETGTDLEQLRACYLTSQALEDAARKVAARMAQIARFQDNMLEGQEVIQDQAHDWALNWNAKADRLQERADGYSAQIRQKLAA